MSLLNIRLLFAFARFFFAIKKLCFCFLPHFDMFIFSLTRLSHTGQKFSKNIFYKGVQLCFETSLFEQNFDQYVAVYLVRKGTYKNAEENAHTFWRRKNLKKRTKSNTA